MSTLEQYVMAWGKLQGIPNIFTLSNDFRMRRDGDTYIIELWNEARFGAQPTVEAFSAAFDTYQAQVAAATTAQQESIAATAQVLAFDTTSAKALIDTLPDGAGKTLWSLAIDLIENLQKVLQA